MYFNICFDFVFCILVILNNEVDLITPYNSLKLLVAKKVYKDEIKLQLAKIINDENIFALKKKKL